MPDVSKLGCYGPPAISRKSGATPSRLIVFDVEETRDDGSSKFEEDHGEDNRGVISEGGTKLQRVQGESGLNRLSEKGDTMV